MKYLKILLLIILSVNSFTLFSEESPVILADKKEITEHITKAFGHVEIRWKDYVIYADYVEFDTKTKIARIQGRVSISSENTILSGDELVFDMRKMSGVMYDASGMMSPSVRFKSDKVDQKTKEILKTGKMEFTPCCQRVPRWKVTCSKSTVKKEKYIEMTNAVIWLKNIPVFYLPWMRYPIGKERTTGFLIPKIGNSTQKGFFLSSAFYVNLRSNLDLTLSHDYYKDAGNGASGEFRYLFNNAEGQVKYYRFNYNDKGKKLIYGDDEENWVKSDYHLNVKHNQHFKFLNTRIIVNIDRQSNPSFLRLFAKDFERALMARFNTSASLTSSVSNFDLSVSASKYQTYYTYNNTKTSMYYLPSVKLNMNKQKIWKIPGYFTVKTAYDRTRRTGIQLAHEPSYDVSESNKYYQKLLVQPMYTLKLLNLPWLSATVEASSKHKFYADSKDLSTGEVINKTLHIKSETVDTTLNGPSFFRIYGKGRKKVKHLIEPSVMYRYVTAISEEDQLRLIKTDGSDYPGFSFLRFSLTNRLLYKDSESSDSPRELLVLTTSQTYYFDPEEANKNRMILGEYPKYSDLTNRLRLRLTENFSIDASLSYNHTLKKFVNVSVSASYSDKESPVSGSVGYSSYTNPYVTDINYAFNRDVLRGTLNIDFENFPIKMISSVEYDFTAINNKLRYASVNAFLDLQCLTLNASLGAFSWTGRTETRFSFGINFGNFGDVKDKYSNGRLR